MFQSLLKNFYEKKWKFYKIPVLESVGLLFQNNKVFTPMGMSVVLHLSKQPTNLVY